MLADEWVRRAAAASVTAVLRADGCDGLSFQSVARRAGLSSDEVRRVFPSKADMVPKASWP
jgi:transcriptional regulator GlxA family with amidase domain